MYRSQVTEETFSNDCDPTEGCKAIDKETGKICGEKDSLKILKRFKNVYENRVKELEDDKQISEPEKTVIKLEIMTNWVQDLEEQNTMLVKAVQDLEEATVCRVELLENKLHESSNLVPHHISRVGSDELTNRISALEKEEQTMNKKIEDLNADISNLLKLLQKARLQKEWNIDEFTWNEVDPSAILMECQGSQIAACSFNVGDNEETVKLRDQLLKNETKLSTLMLENQNKISGLQANLEDQCRKNKALLSRIACLEKESRESRDVLTLEVAEKHDTIISLKNKLAAIEEKCQQSLQYKDGVISELRRELKENASKVPNTKKVRISDQYGKVPDESISDSKLSEFEKEVQKLNNLICLKDKEIVGLKSMLSEQSVKTSKSDSFESESCTDSQVPNARKVRISDQYENVPNESISDSKLSEFEKEVQKLNNLICLKDKEIVGLKSMLSEQSLKTSKSDSFESESCTDSQHDIASIVKNLKGCLEKGREDTNNSKKKLQLISQKLPPKQNMNDHKAGIALANELLQEVTALIPQLEDIAQSKENVKDCLKLIENNVVALKNLLTDKCEHCAQENKQFKLEMSELTSKISSVIRNLTDLNENYGEMISKTKLLMNQNGLVSHKTSINEEEQKGIFAAIIQQYRLMEEFRICTVEVQAATEDLKEEVADVLSNLNSQHCKYLEVSKISAQVQEYILRTVDKVSSIRNHLQLQETEKARHSDRISNSNVRLKDIKNEVNRLHSELSKCLKNVQSSSQQTNVLGYAETLTCNELLSSLIDEVESLVNNTQIYQNQESTSVSLLSDLQKHFASVDHDLKNEKNNINALLQANRSSKKEFEDTFKKMEKYESEIDCCHTKMQHVLEEIVAIREQLNEFGCIKESTDSYKCTNETIKMKDDIRKLNKECEKLRCKLSEDVKLINQNKTSNELDIRTKDYEDEIVALKDECKSKQDANDFLKKNIGELEEELKMAQKKADEIRKTSSAENVKLKKKIFELENKVGEVGLPNDISLNSTEKLEDATKIMSSLENVIDNIEKTLKCLENELTKSFIGNESMTDSIENLSKNINSMKLYSMEIGKMKKVLPSTLKIVERKYEIIKLQEANFCKTEMELEDLRKRLQDKISTQEKFALISEIEKQQLLSQIELQTRKIGRLQATIVDAKNNFEQLSESASRDVSDL